MIDDRAAKLLRVRGFIAVYFENLKTEKSCESAYNATELEYAKHFGKKRYKNWLSFRNAKSKINKK